MEVSGQLHVPAALPHRERAPGTQWIGGWVDICRSGRGGEEKKFSPAPTGNRTPIVYAVILTGLSWLVEMCSL